MARYGKDHPDNENITQSSNSNSHETYDDTKSTLTTPDKQQVTTEIIQKKTKRRRRENSLRNGNPDADYIRTTRSKQKIADNSSDSLSSSRSSTTGNSKVLVENYSSIPSLQTHVPEEMIIDRRSMNDGSNSNNSGSNLFASMEHDVHTDVTYNHETGPITSTSISEKQQHGPTLFGNVMKNIAQSSGWGGSTQQQQQQQWSSSDPTTVGPVQHPTTPARTQSLSNHVQQQQNFAAASPGGFKLLEFINGFTNSPLFQKFSTKASSSTMNLQYTSPHHRTPKPIKSSIMNEQTPEPHSYSQVKGANHFHGSSSAKKTHSIPYMAATPRHEIEWHECNVNASIGYMPWMDWSIKSSIIIECQPNIDLSSMINKPNINHAAIQLFNLNENHHDVNHHDSVQAAFINLLSALHYWQHPSAFPLPKEVFTSKTVEVSQKSLDPKKKMFEFVSTQPNNNSNSRLLMPPPQKHMRAFTSISTNKPKSNSNIAGSMMILNPNSHSINIDTFLQNRGQEWQAAFQSLYTAWIEKIGILNKHWNNGCLDKSLQCNDGKIFMKKVSETYFYSIGTDHTILFRATTTASIHDSMHFIPEIIISSSTIILREKLRTLGVQLIMSHEWEGHTGEFKEEWLLGSTNTKMQGVDPIDDTNSKTTDVTTSPNVMAELVALRRAQMSGWGVGADIAVTIKPKKTKQKVNSISPNRIPPLQISGVDSCASFFDVYYESMGLSSANLTNSEKNILAKNLSNDVPILLSRKIGPFLHGSIKSAIPTFSGDNSKKGSTVIDLQGCFLPCAFRDVVCAAINLVTSNKDLKFDREAFKPNLRDDVHNVGTHHFVIRTTVQHTDDEKMELETGRIGSRSGNWFNGSWNVCQYAEHDLASQSCQQDEIVQMTIWDVSRPDLLAMKLDHLSPVYLK